MRTTKATCFLALLLAAGCDGPNGPDTGVGFENALSGEWSGMVTEVARRDWMGERGGAELVTAHYRVFATTTNAALRRYFPGFMEAAYRDYLRLTQLPERGASERMPIYLMSTYKEWAALTRHAVGTDVPIQAGGYTYKGTCVFWDIGTPHTFAVARHEGLHQFFHHNLPDRLPMWLEEGTCVLAEGMELAGDSVRFTPAHNPLRFNSLRNTIVQNHWIPLDELLPLHSTEATAGFPEPAHAYYSQLWALVLYIHSRDDYRAGMRRLFADARDGRLHESLEVSRDELARLRRSARTYNRRVSTSLFRHYITGDLEAFENNFKDFARKLVELE